MVTMQRKLSRLRADFKLLSDEVTHLRLAEEHRLMMEINIPANTFQHISDSKHWRDWAAQMRVMSDWTKDAETKATMLKLADDYDALAERCGPPASTSH